MSVVGVFNRRFDADLAVAQLESAGIEATILTDISPETGQLNLSGPGFRVVVSNEVADDATTLLNADHPETVAEVDELDAMYFRRRFRDRPTWIRWATVMVLVAVLGPTLLALLFELRWLSGGLFP